MRQTALVLLAVLTAAGAGAEEAPYKRFLQGEDASKAAALQKQVDDLWAAAKFAEAIKPAEELLALRKRLQGEDHWQAADAARQVVTLNKEARLPAPKPGVLGEVPALRAKGFELYRAGKYAQAEGLFRNILAIQEEALGARHPETAKTYSNLGAMLVGQGRAKEAEPWHRKALAIYEEALGPRHETTAAGCNNLANSLQNQGRSGEAEALLRQALAVYEEVLGPRHPHTAQSCDSVAVNLQAQGRYREAEPLLRKALAVREEVLGPRHVDTARSWNNLAAYLVEQDRPQEAESLLRQALAVREEVLGPKHPDIAVSCNNLGRCLQALGRFPEAELLYRKGLAVSTEALGSKHPNTAICCLNLSANLEVQGRAQEAEALARKALAIFTEVLGLKHPLAARTCGTLAGNLRNRGRYREAEALARQGLAALEEVLGPRHPYTALGAEELARDLDGLGRHQEAEVLFRKALAVQEEAHGSRSSDAATVATNLGLSLHAQERYKEAEEQFRKALTAYEEARGPRHPHTATACGNLGATLREQGRYEEAEPLLRKALANREEVPGRRHPDTARACDNLAANLQAQGRYREAETLWRAAAEGVEAGRLRLAATAIDRAVAVRFHPHFGLAATLARLERPAEAWEAAEAGLARGLLDDLARRSADPEDARRLRECALRLESLDRLLIPLLTAEKLDEAGRSRRDKLLADRTTLDAEIVQEGARLSRQVVRPREEIQDQLAPDAALVFWVDFHGADHWGCVLRHKGPPAWVRLPASGPEGDLARLLPLLREDLAHGEAETQRHARRLAALRLDPLEPALAASGNLPAVRHLVVVPFGWMAGIPVEVLSDRYLVSYAPSGSVLARLRKKHRPLESSTLLALGDPNFTLPGAGPPPAPPDHGLYLAAVVPGGNAAKAGLRGGDVLLSYGGTRLNAAADLKPAGGDAVPVTAWRDGKTLDSLRVLPGKLDVVLGADAPAAALRKRREVELLADARSRDEIQPLPGTRLEVSALAALLPPGKSTLLLGSRASEQELAALAAAGKLKDYRLVHLATHATVDPVSAAHSALLLARDRLPGPAEQAGLAATKDSPTGRLSVEAIADTWQLDADLVALSACRTAVGPAGGGEGLLGFSQVLLGRGARSVLLSLWKVDDTATALLMTRFYENLLGQREGLKAPLPKAESLQEAKSWLRALRRADVEELAGKLTRSVVRAAEEPVGKLLPAVPVGETPFAHPRFWAAFILIGDPE